MSLDSFPKFFVTSDFFYKIDVSFFIIIKNFVFSLIPERVSVSITFIVISFLFNCDINYERSFYSEIRMIE